MSIDFVKMKESENLIPIEIPQKEEYLWDLLNVENNFTGRMDANIANTFLLESVQLIRNSIFLFEKGYFDCAYYSLRQSIEISTTMLYLVDTEEENKVKELKKWREKSRFPMYKKMLELLESEGAVFKNMKEHMTEYFNELTNVKNNINKYVHKQGFDTFYISRSHPLFKKDPNEFFLSEFEEYLKKCIGAVAVFRLSIDPFPVLLMDSEIYHRTGDLMSIAYSDEFISKYIGEDYIASYKLTDFYQNHYFSIISGEKKTSCVSDVVKNQYIDKEKIPEILKQSHLLYKDDQIAVVMAGFSQKVSRIYFGNGMWSYFTSTNSNRKDMGSSGLRFKKILDSEVKYNNEYDEAYLSVIKISDENVYIEHNEEFDQKERSELEELTKLLEEKYCEAANITKR